jgi:hypothetical protein
LWNRLSRSSTACGNTPDVAGDGPRGYVPSFAEIALRRHRAFSSNLCFSAGVFAASPVITSSDSRWSLHTAMSFAKGKGGDLTVYLSLLAREKFYAIEYPDGRPRSIYPIGASLLALPTVVVVAALEPNWAKNLNDGFNLKTEKFVASMIGAAAGVVFFWIVFSTFQSLTSALLSTFIFSFSTSMWSTATRALWQHGPLVLMLTIAMLLLLRARQRPGLVQFAALPLAMAYLMRPTAVVPIAVFSIYVLLYYRNWFLKYLGWAMIVALPWIAYNLAIYHWVLPPYYTTNAFSESSHFLEGVLGNLFSPSRGLFVFSPVLLFSLSGFILALREKEQRALHVAFGAIVVLDMIIVGSAAVWWAGHSFGPRFTTDIVPFLVYFVPFNFSAFAALKPKARSVGIALLAGLTLMSAAIHANGALRNETTYWNWMPDNIDSNPDRTWDWSDPQFLRGLH